MGAPRKLRITTAVAAVATSMAMIIPTTAAVADPGALVVTGTASLPAFPASGSGTFSGSALGTSSGPASANFNYAEVTCAAGTASGTLTAAGHTANFQWVRLGATAVLALTGGHTGAAVAAFEVTSPAPAALATACTTGPPVAVTALVAGVGAFA